MLNVGFFYWDVYLKMCCQYFFCKVYYDFFLFIELNNTEVYMISKYVFKSFQNTEIYQIYNFWG